jgi:hypothetical protein
MEEKSRPTMSTANKAAIEDASSVPNNPSNSNAPPPENSSKKKRSATYYYAIRKCKGLDGPAIFLKENDAYRLLAQDKSSIHQRFTNFDDADAWIRGKKKASRKRKAEDDGNNSKSKVLKDVIEKNDQLWDQKFDELKTFTETIGDGDPNLAMQKEYRKPQLQAWLSGQRRNYNRYINNEVNEARSQFDRKERFYKLLELGVRLKPDEMTGSWKEWAQKWRDCTLENPSIPLATNSRDEKVVQLADWQNRQIVDYVKMMRKEQPHEMYPHRVKQLREWDFPFPKDVQPPKKVLKTFDERLQEFLDWKEANSSAMVPQSLEGLGEWVKEQRKEYRKKLSGKKTCMSDERLAKLNTAGFVFRIRTPRKLGAGEEAESEAEPPLQLRPPLQVRPVTAAEV